MQLFVVSMWLIVPKKQHIYFLLSLNQKGKKAYYKYFNILKQKAPCKFKIFNWNWFTFIPKALQPVKEHVFHNPMEGELSECSLMA